VKFTPANHVIASLSSALKHLEAEGVHKRFERYSTMAQFITEEMAKLGFETKYVCSFK
jgi:aspartate aminotransferase-like enzyme